MHGGGARFWRAFPNDMAAVSVLVRHCGVEEAWLEREVTRERFHELSPYLVDWKRLSPLLNLSEADVDAIEESSRKAEARRESFLERWHQKMSMRATYRALVDALLKLERVHDARAVCQLRLTGPT